MATYRAELSDATEVGDALQVLYHRDPAPKHRMADILGSDDFVLLIGTVDGAPAGFLQGELLDRLDGATMLLIYDLEVAVEHRRKGVATQLMEHVFSIAREHDVSRCWLLTESDNEAARRLYESIGGGEWEAIGFGWSFSGGTVIT